MGSRDLLHIKQPCSRALITWSAAGMSEQHHESQSLFDAAVKLNGGPVYGLRSATSRYPVSPYDLYMFLAFLKGRLSNCNFCIFCISINM